MKYLKYYFFRLFGDEVLEENYLGDGNVTTRRYLKFKRWEIEV
jgi:hypothetical protein